MRMQIVLRTLSRTLVMFRFRLIEKDSEREFNFTVHIKNVSIYNVLMVIDYKSHILCFVAILTIG